MGYNNLECILNLQNINKNDILNSTCFLNDNNKLFIITSAENDDFVDEEEFDPIKIYDLKGKKIKEINNNQLSINIITTYYHKKFLKNFIIAGYSNKIKSYDYTTNKIYQTYLHNIVKCIHSSVYLCDSEIIPPSFAAVFHQVRHETCIIQDIHPFHLFRIGHDLKIGPHIGKIVRIRD